jgi:hypothetical protein
MRCSRSGREIAWRFCLGLEQLENRRAAALPFSEVLLRNKAFSKKLPHFAIRFHFLSKK